MRFKLVLASLVLAVIGLTGYGLLHAQKVKADTADDFSLIVTPSPIIAEVTPGQSKEIDLKIYNQGINTENLQITPVSFTYNSTTGKIQLNNTPPPDIGSWLSFDSQKFAIPSNQSYTEKINLSVPQDAQFSYSLALVINRQGGAALPKTGSAYNGSVAVFTLVNVDRPGVVSKLSLVKFSVSHHVYEWLPANISVRLKNSGNSIIAPAGNIFISRSPVSAKSIDTLTFNSSGGYVLPNTSRTFNSSWSNGFPVYTTVLNSNGTANKQKLTWNWSNLGKFRIGKYYASLVGFYFDGQRDVPIEAEVSFWVIPWKLILVVLIIVLLVIYGIYSIVKNLVKKTKKQPTESKSKEK